MVKMGVETTIVAGDGPISEDVQLVLDKDGTRHDARDMARLGKRQSLHVRLQFTF